MGTGLLGMPYVFRMSGIIEAALIIIVVGIMSAYSITMLSRTAIIVGATSYEELGKKCFGRAGYYCVTLFTMILLFGSMTSYVVVIGDTMEPVVEAMGIHFLNRQLLTVIISLVFIFPLCSMPSVRNLEVTSIAAVVILLFFAAVVVGTAYFASHTHKIAKDISAIEGNWAIYLAIPIVSLAYSCQTTVFAIWMDIIRKESDRHSIDFHEHRSPREMSAFLNTYSSGGASIQSVGNCSMAVCGSLYFIVGVCGYISYGHHTMGDFFQDLPEHELLFLFMRFVFAVAIVLHYPLAHFPFRYTFNMMIFGDDIGVCPSRALLTHGSDAPNVGMRKEINLMDKEHAARRYLESLMCVLATTICALTLPGLSTVFELTGALTAFPLCFIMPALFYVRALTTAHDGTIDYVGERRLTPPVFMCTIATLFWIVCMGFSVAELLPKINFIR